MIYGQIFDLECHDRDCADASQRKILTPFRKSRERLIGLVCFLQMPPRRHPQEIPERPSHHRLWWIISTFVKRRKYIKVKNKQGQDLTQKLLKKLLQKYGQLVRSFKRMSLFICTLSKGFSHLSSNQYVFCLSLIPSLVLNACNNFLQTILKCLGGVLGKSR